MILKNNKTFYLIFLFIVISLHTYILTSVLSVKNTSANNQAKIDQDLIDHYKDTKKFKPASANYYTTPQTDSVFIKSFNYNQE
jgi:hypothetical protein